MKRLLRIIFTMAFLLFDMIGLFGQSMKNKIKSLTRHVEGVPSGYVLPNPLQCMDGTEVTSVKQWEKKRRPELLELFTTYMYGKVPDINNHPIWKLLKEEIVLGGKAIRKDVKIWPLENHPEYSISVQIYLPPSCKRKPVPLFLGMSFHPNFTVCKDEGVEKPSIVIKGKDGSIVHYSRGEKEKFWNLDKILERGYGLATVWYQELFRDTKEDFENGFPSLFFKPGLRDNLPDEWGAISIWAWELSLVMDYIETDKNLDKRKVITIGHSRLAKTAIWAAVRDQRFAMAIGNNSGCSGAALSIRRHGETIKAINEGFPHWFCGNYKQFNGREEYAPFEQHELIALMAPRPIYIASAEDDNWSDPLGEFLGGKYASSVYHLYGEKGLECDSIPPVGEPQVDGRIGYHIRKGKHDMTLYDMEQYLDFVDMHLGRKISSDVTK